MEEVVTHSCHQSDTTMSLCHWDAGDFTVAINFGYDGFTIPESQLSNFIDMVTVFGFKYQQYRRQNN